MQEVGSPEYRAAFNRGVLFGRYMQVKVTSEYLRTLHGLAPEEKEVALRVLQEQVESDLKWLERRCFGA